MFQHCFALCSCARFVSFVYTFRSSEPVHWRLHEIQFTVLYIFAKCFSSQFAFQCTLYDHRWVWRVWCKKWKWKWIRETPASATKRTVIHHNKWDCQSDFRLCIHRHAWNSYAFRCGLVDHVRHTMKKRPVSIELFGVRMTCVYFMRIFCQHWFLTSRPFSCFNNTCDWSSAVCKHRYWSLQM